MGNASRKFILHKSTSCDIVHVSSKITLSQGYYWRDYLGEIPSDALIAGKDEKGENIYVGQAYRENAGIMPVQISTGDCKVYTYMFREVKETTRGIKILCGDPDNFEWVSNELIALCDKIPVMGGFDAHGDYHIGKVSYEGGEKIGKIAPGADGEQTKIYFVHNGNEVDAISYDILVHKKGD